MGTLMTRGYLANGLFSLSDQMFNEHLANTLRKDIEGLALYVPQENEALNDKNGYANSVTIAEGDCFYLHNSDFVVAVIDGVEIDSGVSAEIGIAHTLGIPVFALYTDLRQQGRNNVQKLEALIEDGTENQFAYRNLFVIGLIKQSGGGVFNSIEELQSAIQQMFIKGAV